MLFGDLCCPALRSDGVAGPKQAVLFAPNTIRSRAVHALNLETKKGWMILCGRMVWMVMQALEMLYPMERSTIYPPAIQEAQT